MKKETRFFHKTQVCLLLATGALLFSACGGTAKTGATISIEGDGKVSTHIVESFDKAYYDKEELQLQKILMEAADYNRETGGANVSVEKIAVENGTATVKMTYAKAEDYAAFNEELFFLGSAQKAQEEGYDINVVLSNTKDELVTIGMSDILSMPEYQLLIMNVTDTVNLDGRAEYVSDNVIVSKNRKTVSLAEASEKPAYILIKK